MAFRELALLASLLAPAAAVEMLWPRRELRDTARRWMTNISLAVIWVVALQLLWPWMHGGVSTVFRGAQIIDLPTAGVPPLLVGLGSLLLLDFIQYWTHRGLHRYQWLWYLHRVHHSDSSVDASTGVRHHPIEPLLNAPVQYAFIVVLGVPAEGAALYALVATVQTIIAHSNLHLPTRMDRLARCLIVTPDMHHIHHSTEQDEANSNYGMVFPFWDHLFRTYRAQPRHGHDKLQVGVIS